MAESAGPRATLYRVPALLYDNHVEDPEHYKPGGYHPIDIGDILTNATSGDRYTVIHKLGYGGFSTVWLAKRQRKHPLTGDPLPISFHALKILRADLDRASHESGFLQCLGQVGKSSHPNVIMLEDSFTISGPNGQHHCLVFPFVGPSISSSKIVDKLTPSQRHSVCQQLANAIDFMHSHGICHGDLIPSNIALTVPGIQSMTEYDLLGVLGPIKDETLQLRKGPVPRSRHAPKKIVAAASFSGFNFGSASLPRVQIIDFGVAFHTNRPPPTLGCPMQFFPPELLFGYQASDKSDIWQLAAIIFYVYTGCYMFQVGFPIFAHLIAFIIKFHGPLPSHWRDRYDWSRDAKPGKPVKKLVEPSWWFDGTKSTESFDNRVAEEATSLPAPQRVELAKLLRDMVAWEPSSRISAAEAYRRLKEPIFQS